MGAELTSDDVDAGQAVQSAHQLAVRLLTLHPTLLLQGLQELLHRHGAGGQKGSHQTAAWEELASTAALPFLQGQELPPHSLGVAAGLPQPQQRVQDAVHGAAVQAAQLQAPVGDLLQFEQSVAGADLVLAVVEVPLHGGEVQPVHLLRLGGDLDLKGGEIREERRQQNGFKPR